MAKGTQVGTFPTTALAVLLGESVEIRKSGRENAKFPLYLSTRIGPIPVNTRAGQDLLLESGSFKGAPGSEVEQKAEKPKEIPEVQQDERIAGIEAKPEVTKVNTWFTGDESLGF